MVRTTLLDIGKYSDKLEQLILFTVLEQKGEIENYSSLNDCLYINPDDNYELFKAFNKDFNRTINSIIDIQKLLTYIDNDGTIIEFKGKNKNVADLFGKLYNPKNKSVTINGIEFKVPVKTPLSTADIKLSLLKKYFPDVNVKLFLYLANNIEKVASASEGMEVLSNYSVEKFLSAFVEEIKPLANRFIEKRKKYNKDEQKYIDNYITYTRAMLDGVIQQSTYITNIKDEENQYSTKHKLAQKNGDIEKLEKFLKKSKYFSAVEIDPDTDVLNTLQVLKQIEELNLFLDKKIIFKVRKLGNYQANGIAIPSLNTAAVDEEKPSATIHELTHLIYENFKDNPETIKLVNYFNSKLVLNNMSYSKQKYYRKPTEIIARLGEIAMLRALDFKDGDVGLVKKEEHYKTFEGIYFSYNSLTKEDFELIDDYFKSYFRSSIELNIEPMISRQREIIVQRVERNTKDIKSGINFKLFTPENIEEILEFNLKNNVVPIEEVIETIFYNIRLTGNQRMKEAQNYTLEKAQLINKICDFVQKKYPNGKELLEDFFVPFVDRDVVYNLNPFIDFLNNYIYKLKGISDYKLSKEMRQDPDYLKLKENINSVGKKEFKLEKLSDYRINKDYSLIINNFSLIPTDTKNILSLENIHDLMENYNRYYRLVNKMGVMVKNEKSNKYNFIDTFNETCKKLGINITMTENDLKLEDSKEFKGLKEPAEVIKKEIIKSYINTYIEYLNKLTGNLGYVYYLDDKIKKISEYYNIMKLFKVDIKPMEEIILGKVLDNMENIDLIKKDIKEDIKKDIKENVKKEGKKNAR